MRTMNTSLTSRTRTQHLSLSKRPARYNGTRTVTHQHRCGNEGTCGDLVNSGERRNRGEVCTGPRTQWLTVVRSLTKVIKPRHVVRRGRAHGSAAAAATGRPGRYGCVLASSDGARRLCEVRAVGWQCSWSNMRNVSPT